MAININIQGMVDQMVENMSTDAVQIEAKKAISSKFSDIVQDAIQKHGNAIAELKAVANGDSINAALIAYHEKRITYYAS